jgi:hypothetical protein
MPEYHVNLVHTLRIVGVATVTADSEAAALAQMQQRAAAGKLGRVEWRMVEDQSGVEEWYEQEVHLTIETVVYLYTADNSRFPGTGSVEWACLPILKQPFLQTPVQFSRDPCVVGMPGRVPPACG